MCVVDSKEIERQIKNFCKNIRVFRKRQGMTRQKLSDLTGISRPYLYQLEELRSSPSLDYARKIVRALGVTFEEMFQEVDQAWYYWD